MKFNNEEIETLYYACADAEKYWRHTRKQVKSGNNTLYTEDDCTVNMKKFHGMWEKLSYEYNTDEDN